uniref:Immunoglobulin domain-containing protein n=1 Tax=Paramormyrops kingsleyae TaxID=1676925 RepID=A0A3B3S7B9_9TELE
MTGEWAVWYPEKSVCAVRGSTVVMSCEYHYPQLLRVETVMWCHNTYASYPYVCHSNNENVSAQYTGRAECLGDTVKITKLRIKDIRDTDAGQYRFRFITNDTAGKWTGNPGVILKVDGGAWTVDYPEKTVRAVRGSTVVIKCRYDFPESYKVDSMIWSHNTDDCAGKSHVYNSNNTNISAQYADRAEFLGNKEKNCTLMIKNITETDAGVYRFSFTANGCLQCGQHGVALQVVAKGNPITILVLVLVILLAVLAVIYIIIRRKRDSLTVVNDRGGETQIPEDNEYTNITESVSQNRNQRQEVSSQMEEVCYASVQFSTEQPDRQCDVSNTESRDDAVIYAAVRTPTNCS